MLYQQLIKQAHSLIPCLRVIVSNFAGKLNHDLVACTAELCDDIDLVMLICLGELVLIPMAHVSHHFLPFANPIGIPGSRYVAIYSGISIRFLLLTLARRYIKILAT